MTTATKDVGVATLVDQWEADSSSISVMDFFENRKRQRWGG